MVVIIGVMALRLREVLVNFNIIVGLPVLVVPGCSGEGGGGHRKKVDRVCVGSGVYRLERSPGLRHQVMTRVIRSR